MGTLRCLFSSLEGLQVAVQASHRKGTGPWRRVSSWVVSDCQPGWSATRGQASCLPTVVRSSREQQVLGTVALGRVISWRYANTTARRVTVAWYNAHGHRRPLFGGSGRLLLNCENLVERPPRWSS